MKNGMIKLVGITLSLSFFSVANITAMDCVEDCCNLCFCNLFALVDSHNVSNRTNRISSELNQAKKPSRAYLEKIEEFYEKSDYEESCDYNVLMCFEDPYFIRQRSSAYNDRLKFMENFYIEIRKVRIKKPFYL